MMENVQTQTALQRKLLSETLLKAFQSINKKVTLQKQRISITMLPETDLM
jgi:hypothetical protein